MTRALHRRHVGGHLRRTGGRVPAADAEVIPVNDPTDHISDPLFVLRGDLGKGVVGSAVDTWQSWNPWSSIPTPIVLAAPSEGQRPSDDGNSIRFEGSQQLEDVTANILATADDEFYFAFCGERILSTAGGTVVLSLGDGVTPAVRISTTISVAIRGQAVDGSGALLTGDSAGLIDVPSVLEVWSDGVNLNARADGGLVSTLAWTTTRWNNTMAQFLISGAMDWRVREVLGNLGYPGDAAAASYRTVYCAAQHGYGGA